MRKSLLGGSIALVLLVAACQPTKPPPPPPENFDRDVLLLGDSVGFGVGCMLGDNGPDNDVPCPPKSGFSTVNAYLGACAVAEGQILLYNSTAVEGNCNAPNSDATTLWPQVVDAVTPKVVVIVTGGWEIVHRWSNLPLGCNATAVLSCARPDRQMGSTAEGGALNLNAVNHYKNEMTAVITAIRNRPSHPKVLLLNSPYVQPIGPDPSNSWFEAYPLVKPFNWNSPNTATPYISSKVKIEEFNNAVEEVADGIGLPADVVSFDFWQEFSPVIDGAPAFSFSLCAYPDNMTDPGACPPESPPFQARLNDAGHLTTAGNTLLGCYLLPELYGMLGIVQPDPC